MSDDETIDPSRVSKNERKEHLSGDTTAAHLDVGRSGPDTSVDSDLSEAVSKYRTGDVVDGAYRLTALLGRGGMGVVFACNHLALDQDYAIKLLSGESLSDEHWRRFQAEAKTLAKLNHPGIVGLYNMGIDKGSCPYFVMDLLSGEALDSLIKRSGPLAVNQALDCFIQVADALSCAHLQGIIHRDIKPSNLMLIRDNANSIARVKIVDFGIARLSKQSLGTQSQTATGLIFGTPIYMSPEQCQGLRVDERSDIYSFGCALFEALTGSPPFRGDNAFQTFLLHQTEPPPRLVNAAPETHFPQSLELAVDKMLRKAPADRYQKMDQVMHDLERIKAGKEILIRGQTSKLMPGGINLEQQEAYREEESGGPEVSTQRDVDTTGSQLPWARLAIIALIALSLSVGSFFVFDQSHRRQKSPVSNKENKQPDVGVTEIIEKDEIIADVTSLKALQKIGCSEREIDALRKYDVFEADKKQREVAKRFRLYWGEHLKDGTRFLSKDKTVFNFPQGIVIGAISFDAGKPVVATGQVKVQKGKSVRFYESYCIRESPEFADFFGSEDLTALELTSEQTDKLLQKIRAWKNLKELSFFNSLTKPMPNWEKYDQSTISDNTLPQLEQFTRLTTLGLCGKEVTGGAIAKMKLLHTIQSLRLKTITDPSPVLRLLPELDNLKEVWLMGLDTTDNQLEFLVKMKNLESVRIRRSALTPKSLASFSKMHCLKHLCLDRNWSDREKKQFQSVIPFCQFESVVDQTYWKPLVTK